MKKSLFWSCVVCIFLILLLMHSYAYSKNMKEVVLSEFNKRSVFKTQSLTEETIKLMIEQQQKKETNNTDQTLSSKWESVVSGSNVAESEVYSAINPNDSNNIIVSPIYIDQENMFDGFYCPVYYTTNFGNTWNRSSFKAKPSRSDLIVMGGGDPVLAFDSKGRAYLAWLSLSIKLSGFSPDSIFWSFYWAYSDNGGKDWIRPTVSHLEMFTMDYKSGQSSGLGMPDKEWFAMDNSGGQYQDNLYMSFVRITPDQSGQASYELYLYTKKAGNNYFEPQPVKIASGNYDFKQFCTIDVDALGYVHASFFASKNGKTSLYHAISKDGGKNFLPETKISDFSISGSEMITPEGDSLPGVLKSRLYPAPEIAVDGSNSKYSGNIYVTWTADASNKKYKNVYFSRSINEGKTWSTPISMYDDKNNPSASNFYSAIAVNNSGYLALSWYDRRGDSQDAAAHYYMALSFDGGASFTNSFPVSSQSSDFLQIGFKNNGFGIGEYNKMVTTKGYAIPIWADGRRGSGNVDLYAAFIPFSGEHVSVERIVPLSSDFSLNAIAPNPVSGELSFSFTIDNPQKAGFLITDINGKIVRTISEEYFGAGYVQKNISVSDLTQGLYFLRMNTDKGYAVQRFSIEK